MLKKSDKIFKCINANMLADLCRNSLCNDGFYSIGMEPFDVLYIKIAV